jgi:hypothetical protein
MRVVAPVEWNLGLPFPSSAAMVDAGRAIDLPEEIRFSTWFESRAKARQSTPTEGSERRLAA